MYYLKNTSGKESKQYLSRGSWKALLNQILHFVLQHLQRSKVNG
ncbi:unnamed protein product [Callosobruchus maculatus]|uniref:Uncharacterized protein n=1 Tax=Callosobruchus maculatus TaxID=64391 RepID=A0A653BRU3_CALMS|nr:unnamed protein product [Callosobruchus maculatus]